MSTVLDVTDDVSDDEGEVPPLLGPGAGTATVASIPSAAPKKPAAAKPQPAAAAAAAPAQPLPPKPGANLKPSAGLRKGFLGGSGSSSRPNKAASSSSSASAKSSGGEQVPMVRADADARARSLQLPEVQSTLEAEKAEAAKLGANGKTSWMTPELMAKIAANPLLRKGFMDPRCQQAMSEMQTDPQAAMKKYGDVPEMRTFLQSFMKLMGDHFTGLADKEEEEKRKKAEAQASMQEALTPEQKKAQQVAQDAMADPEVRAIVSDPAIQELLANMQTGHPFEVQKALAADPALVRKLQKLKQAGLINVEWKA